MNYIALLPRTNFTLTSPSCGGLVIFLQ